MAKKVDPRVEPSPEKLKYLVDTRDTQTQTDHTIIATNSFRDALGEYERLKVKLDELGHSCSFDLVAFYVLETSSTGYTPVVFSTLEVITTEW